VSWTFELTTEESLQMIANSFPREPGWQLSWREVEPGLTTATRIKAWLKDLTAEF